MPRRIRLLLIIESMGGSSRHVVDLIDGLDPERFEITLIHGTSRVDDYFAAALPRLRQRARVLGCPDLVREISPAHEARALRFVRRVIRDIRPDVVHCHSSKAGAIGRVAAKLCGVGKVFYTPHAYAFLAPEFGGKKRMVFVGIERFLSRHATTLTFNVSQGERSAALAEHLDRPDKFEVVYNGIADIPLPTKAEAREALGLPQDVPVAGVTARLVEQKDPMTSVRIAAQVLQARPDAHFAYIGDGDFEERMRQAAREAGVADRVHFLGYRKDADRLVTAFDAYLLTSLYEGMPYSLVEALRAGVPIAATRTTGNDEVVIEGENGTLFPVGDVQAGAVALLGLLDDPPSRERVRATYLERFTVRRMLDHIAARYEQRGTDE
ncbi:glycosyltransferase family 4 protein [Bifidobacterium pullorum subsp. saeculare]|uniref:Glycosyltransferase family 4 protein n=2 Tax=Bifidobacterium pullorum TaxID=78448 RepID=A0A938WZ17_9BIFI|nr:glycosyltransferase family 4 protein [Bifidobacterium pullorum subsp. saeculare]